MTTIATDGKTMAADTQQMSQFIHRLDSVKLHRIDGFVYGGSGDWSCVSVYYNWVRAGRPQNDRPAMSDKWSVIFIKDGLVWQDDEYLVPNLVGSPYAIGSGAEYAMGAMLAGATPSQAVRIAIALDSGTGGKVRTMKWV